MLTLLSLFFLHSSVQPALAYLTPEEMFLQDQSQFYGTAGVALPINPRRAQANAQADAASRQATASSQSAAYQAVVHSSSSVSSDDHHAQNNQANFWNPSTDASNTNLDPETIRMLKQLEYQSHLQSMQLTEPPPSGSRPLASSGPGMVVAFGATILAVGVTTFVAWKRKIRGMSF